MTNLLKIANDGPNISETNFAETEFGRVGFCYVSANAGALRLLLPPSIEQHIPDMRKGAKHFVLSFIPTEQFAPKKYALEWMIVWRRGRKPGLQAVEPQGRD